MMQNISYLNVHEKDVSAIEVPNILHQNSGCSSCFKLHACSIFLAILLNLCLLGIFACFFCHLLNFLIMFFKKLFQEMQYNQSVKQFGSRSGRQHVGPGLGPKCLQRLSADDTKLQL